MFEFLLIVGVVGLGLYYGKQSSYKTRMDRMEEELKRLRSEVEKLKQKVENE